MIINIYVVLGKSLGGVVGTKIQKKNFQQLRKVLVFITPWYQNGLCCTKEYGNPYVTVYKSDVSSNCGPLYTVN